VKPVRAATIGVVVATGISLGGPWVPSGPAVASATVPDAGASTAFEQDPRFERSYRYAGGAAGKKAIETAVEEAVRKMNPLIRGIARRRMLDANRVIPELAFQLGGDPLVASYVGGRVIEAPADGRPVAWKDQYGETIQVSHRLRETTLLQTMAGSKGDRVNRYRFSADGKTMTMSVEIASDKLPAPLRYSIAYRLVE
jgi:hypothetical protein